MAEKPPVKLAAGQKTLAIFGFRGITQQEHQDRLKREAEAGRAQQEAAAQAAAAEKARKKRTQKQKEYIAQFHQVMILALLEDEEFAKSENDSDQEGSDGDGDSKYSENNSDDEGDDDTPLAQLI